MSLFIIAQSPHWHLGNPSILKSSRAKTLHPFQTIFFLLLSSQHLPPAPESAGISPEVMGQERAFAEKWRSDFTGVLVLVLLVLVFFWGIWYLGAYQDMLYFHPYICCMYSISWSSRMQMDCKLPFSCQTGFCFPGIWVVMAQHTMTFLPSQVRSSLGIWFSRVLWNPCMLITCRYLYSF